eukprot:1787377-Pyramimonas_sp.AAC.1
MFNQKVFPRRGPAGPIVEPLGNSKAGQQRNMVPGMSAEGGADVRVPLSLSRHGAGKWKGC